MKVLFVCVKNASRSPMAEALLKMSAKHGVEVCSAGIKPGKKVNTQAVKTMREVSYDLSGHEPTHISEFFRHHVRLYRENGLPRSRRHGHREMDRGLEHPRPGSGWWRGVPHDPADDRK